MEKCASNVAQATLIEEEMASLVTKMEELDNDENKLLKMLEEEEAVEKEKKAAEEAEKATNEASEPPKKKKKKSKDKSKDSSTAAAEEAMEAPPPAKIVDPRLLTLEKSKLTTLLELQSLSLQLPPLRDNTDNLLRQLQYRGEE